MLSVFFRRVMPTCSKYITGPAAGTEWCLYDVGGSRTQRAAWTPYFDDCDAIIFLAPISCFDEKLAEDRRVNRLEDSYALWKMICSNKLLYKAQIILFLNKCDLRRCHTPLFSPQHNAHRGRSRKKAQKWRPSQGIRSQLR